MRLLSNRRGQVRVIEAFFASLLLLSCLTLIPSVVNSKEKTDNLASRGENVLLTLDNDGRLASLIDSQDWSGLKDCIESTLPLAIWFNLTVFDQSLNTLNEYPICNSAPVSDNIVSINYICASPDPNYRFYLLQLQLAGMN